MPLLDNLFRQDIITLLKRWCWNWQTGVVEGHVPLRREGSTPSQRIQTQAHKQGACFFKVSVKGRPDSTTFRDSQVFRQYQFQNVGVGQETAQYFQ
jgi:hypothetical protein